MNYFYIEKDGIQSKEKLFEFLFKTLFFLLLDVIQYIQFIVSKKDEEFTSNQQLTSLSVR